VQAGVKNTRISIGVLTGLAIVAAALCFFRITTNPPGFYIDESSIAYNAHTIARTGADESGVRWPLYFRAFGDYKNPVYVYILAALFRLTGPSLLVPRLLSAICVVLAAGTFGLLAARLKRSRIVALLTAILALLTPWFFEVGRVTMEVALYPLACGLFLLCLRRASEKDKWGAVEVLSIAATLALLTYAYSIGRLLAPLVALGLAFFWTRERWRSLLATLFAYVALVSPIVLFSINHPTALVERFSIITYLRPNIGLAEAIWEFAWHYLANLNPWRLLVAGDPNPDQVVHVFGTPHFLAPVFVLTIAGIAVAARRAKRESWSRFLLYGFATSIVPSSLTNEAFHMLRLIALPAFLLVFAIEGIAWFLARTNSRAWRIAFVTLLALTAIEAGWFQWNYQRTALTARRVHLFDAEYPRKIFGPALATSAHPIYIADALWIPGYIQAYWYATLQGVDLSRFQKLAPDATVPLGALVISTEENCPGCEILATVNPYTLAIAKEAPRPRTPLPREAFRAELSIVSAPREFHSKERAPLRIRIKNLSPNIWLARERGGGSYQVSVGNHWLDLSGKTVINDDGRSALLRDLKPGETTELLLAVNSPAEPGNYILEIDMLQEGVTWFGLVGSSTVRLPVEVE
jgi:4-amino-4-deoxy-L-arabinose transferase-like glycosyltransferase